MIKRIICFILSVILCMCNRQITVYAEETYDRYTEGQKQLIYNNYKENENMLNVLFCDSSSLGYWTMINEIKKSDLMESSLDISSKIIGEYPEKQDYAEILVNLIVMQEGEFAEQIQNQSQFDDLKSAGDYIGDIIEISGVFLEGGNIGLSENVSIIIDGVTEGTEIILKNVEYAKYYQITIQSYIQAQEFLNVVNKYADNSELREVASSLLTANERLVEKRLEYLSDTTQSITEFEAEVFAEELSFELLKETDLYKNDETVKYYVDCGEQLSNSIGSVFAAGEFAFRMTMLAGDIGFGTSDVFNRYQEMKIISDIAEAIVEANEKIVVSDDSNTSQVISEIQKKCSCYKMLLVVHARGEYLNYQLLVSDAGLLSQFRVLFDYFKNPEDTTDSWYNRQVNVLIEYYEILNKMLQASSAQENSSEQEEPQLIEALERVTSYEEGIETGYYERRCKFDESGICIECEQVNEESGIVSIDQWEYDEYGNEEKWTRHCSNGIVRRGEYTDYAYTEGGLYRKYEQYNWMEEIEYTCEFFYDEEYKLIQELQYDQDGTLLRKIEYTYDSADRIVEDIWYDAQGEIELRNEYFYEQSEKPVYMEKYNNLDELEATHTWEYDENNRKISAYWKDAQGRLMLKSDYEYVTVDHIQENAK